MTLKLLSISALIFAFGLNTADAQTTEKTQRQRVKQGVKSGELTRAETRSIAKMKRETRSDVRAAKADGKVTRAERKEIRRDKRKTSRAIYRKKHNIRQRQ